MKWKFMETHTQSEGTEIQTSVMASDQFFLTFLSIELWFMDKK
jgi:hypothetical protein